MPTAVVPLSKLAERLARMESELQGLRRAYDTRLADLQRRKEELEASLQQVESEIRAAVQENIPAAEPAGPMPSLPEMLLRIVRERGRVVTVKELSAELVARKFPTASNNLERMVGNRVHDLIKKGLLARARRKKGVVLGASKPGPKAKRGRPKKNPDASAHAASNGSAPAADANGRKLSLRDLLSELLAKSPQPLKAKDLAEQALAAGYRTKSKTFIDNVWTALGQMKNVENVSGVGYRLKGSAAS
jgi:hypothetical protein